MRKAKLTKKDYESIKFHIESDDYFGTLATVLSLIEQRFRFTFKDDDDRRKTLRKKVEELNYLQANYKIIRKKK